MNISNSIRRPMAWLLTLAMFLSVCPVFAEAAPSADHTHCACGNLDCTMAGHESFTFDALTDTDVTLDKDAYFLAEDLTVLNEYGYSGDLQVTGDVHLCLAGHTLTLKTIYVRNGGSLTICDCTGTGKIDYTGEYAIYLDRGDHDLTVYGGTIASANDDAKDPVAVFSLSGGDISIYGGTLSGNTGMRIPNVDTLLIDGGSILGDKGFGIEVNSNVASYGFTEILVKSGRISSRKTGIAITSYYGDGRITVSGGTVQSTASTNGMLYYNYEEYCGISIAKSMHPGCAITVSGGTIKGSHNAIYSASAGTTVALSGGTLSGTIADLTLVRGEANVADAPLSLKNYTGDGVTMVLTNTMLDTYIARDVADDGLVTLVTNGLTAGYISSEQAVKIIDPSAAPANPTFAEAFPDPVFRTYITDTVLADNTDSEADDAVITEAQMAAIEKWGSIDLRECSDLTSLQGLEYFTGLQYLYCYNTGITELDISNNTALEYLYCYNTSITALDVSNNPALTYLRCEDTNISELDVSNNPALYHLFCYNTGITELDVSNNPKLEQLLCYNTNITELDLSNNPALTYLYCYNTSITELDLSNNTNLTTIRISPQTPTGPDIPLVSNGRTWTLDLAAFLGDNGDLSKVTMTDGGVLNNGTVTYTAKPKTVTYTYDTGMGQMEVRWAPPSAPSEVTAHVERSDDDTIVCTFSKDLSAEVTQVVIGAYEKTTGRFLGTAIGSYTVGSNTITVTFAEPLPADAQLQVFCTDNAFIPLYPIIELL